MVTRIKTVFIYVSDQDRALEFYRDRLGFEVQADTEMWPGARWLEVVPAGAQTTLSLAAAKDFDRPPGEGSVAMTLATSNAQELYERLRDQGVEVTEPSKENWATSLKVTDPDGHVWVIAEE